MDNEVKEYFIQQYKKVKFRAVPSHWPDFKTKEEVDQWISKMENIMEIAFEKDGRKSIIQKEPSGSFSFARKERGTCIDSGGHFTTEVYKFCKSREHRRIFAIKGKGGMVVPLISKASRNNREKVALFTLRVDAGKELVINRLKVEFEGAAGYCHFPSIIPLL
ncbi:MAG: hypothetical protein PWQ67_1923 [Clostridia bacterium]|jgi:hypothetical protein|nr:hypothetical protein [Clostridia bacterium]MDN5323469.1 hypothetical protein [Clostridia bacterium]